MAHFFISVWLSFILANTSAIPSGSSTDWILLECHTTLLRLRDALFRQVGEQYLADFLIALNAIPQL